MKGNSGTRSVDKTHGILKGSGKNYLTDSPEDLMLPDNIRSRLKEYEDSIKTYDDLKKYLEKEGIVLDTPLDELKQRSNEELKLVSQLGLKIVIANETYKSVFGDDALSSLRKIVIYDENTAGQGDYTARLLGEAASAVDGTMRFRDGRVDYSEVFHEFAHAYQDSVKRRGEDLLSFSSRMVKEGNLDSSMQAYAFANRKHLDAERFAEAFARAFTSKDKNGLQFLYRVRTLNKKKVNNDFR